MRIVFFSLDIRDFQNANSLLFSIFCLKNVVISQMWELLLKFVFMFIYDSVYCYFNELLNYFLVFHFNL